MIRSVPIRWCLVWAALSCTALTACGPGGVPDMSAEQYVTERAQARWDALLAGRLEEAYGYLSPAQRSAMSLRQYQSAELSSQVRKVGASAAMASCEGESCEVPVEVAVFLVAPVPGLRQFEITQKINERWIWTEKEWWYVPRR